MKQKLTFQKKIIILSVSQIILLTGSLSTTLAWFISKRVVTAKVGNVIVVANELYFNIKSFIGNYEYNVSSKGMSGYIDLGELNTPSKTFTDYSTDFISLATNYNFQMSGLVPGARLTFALEVTSSYGNSLVALNMSSFLNLFDTTTFNYVLNGKNNDTVTTKRVGLADAINMYTSVFATENKTVAEITTAANSVVTQKTSDSVDLFNFDSKANIDNGETVAGSTKGEIKYSGVVNDLISSTFDATDSTHTQNMQIFFFTVEFSNLANSYYSTKVPTTETITEGATYFYKDEINGDSNVYKKTTFRINEMHLYKKN
jgi:hypothetical protein